MKTSNKILLVAGAVPVLYIILLFSVLKFLPLGDAETEASFSQPSGMITRTLPVEGFSEITVNGISNVNLYRGDSFLVEVTAPEDEIDNIRAEKTGNTLELEFKTALKNSTGLKGVTADITLPEALVIDMQEVSNIDVSGLNIGSISIRAQGPLNVTGNDATIHDLGLANDGLTRIDLVSVPVTNADLQCQGLYSIVLMMNGGRLTGDLGGIGSFDYQGNVSENGLRINGSRNNMAYRTGQ